MAARQSPVVLNVVDFNALELLTFSSITLDVQKQQLLYVGQRLLLGLHHVKPAKGQCNEVQDCIHQVAASHFEGSEHDGEAQPNQEGSQPIYASPQGCTTSFYFIGQNFWQVDPGNRPAAKPKE